MFDYPLLEILIEVERLGDFERAAKTLGISKSYISQRLRLLEERMGGITVCRDTIKPTEFGSRLCRHYENVCLLEQQFLHDHAELYNVEDPGPVTLKVAVGDESLESWFKSALTRLNSMQDRFFLDIIQATEDEIEQAMKLGGIHAAIRTCKDPLSGFSSHYLGQHTYRSTASPDFVRKHFAKGVTLDALKSAPSMQISSKDKLRNQWVFRATGSEDLEAGGILRSAHGLVNKCLYGDIWSVNSSLLIDDHLKSGELVELVPDLTLASDLYWHISGFISSTMSALTACIISTAATQLIQSKQDAPCPLLVHG